MTKQLWKFYGTALELSEIIGRKLVVKHDTTVYQVKLRRK